MHPPPWKTVRSDCADRAGRARFVVGIDLGTSHTVAAFAPLNGGVQSIELLPIPQRISAGEVASLPLLPSVRYQAAPGEVGEAWREPWLPLDADDTSPAIIGQWARDLGAAVPGRLVAGAKSWLSHAGVDRTAAILPWGALEGEGGVARISPVQASASYLAHVRAAWDAARPDAPLGDQRIVLTVPASFDEGARALTLEAARLAGLPDVHLLEEPKAAFQDWLALQGAGLGQQLKDCRLVLVVDVGGGTTDLTLIRVDHGGSDDGADMPTLTRIAVGEHLMLGGDNMDMALAHRLEPQFAPEGQRLSAVRFSQVVQRCRVAKEQLLASDAPESVAVTLLGGGSGLLAQTRSATLTRDDVRAWVVDGFMPQAALQDMPVRRRGGLRELGLPYPADAAISRHLAQFLSIHAADGQDGERGDCLPDAVLLNGGVFHAHALIQRMQGLLQQWRGSPVRMLNNPHPDWAVARGAAAYGLARFACPAPVDEGQVARQDMPRIGGGSARSYWLVLPGSGKDGKNSMPQGICLLPRGTEEGERVVLQDQRFALRLGQAVRFALVANSRSQMGDSAQTQAGQIMPIDGEGWVALPPLSAVLPAPSDAASAKGQVAQVEVRLQACMTEVGTLEVRCVAANDKTDDKRDQPSTAAQEWLLSFAVRGGQQERDLAADDAQQDRHVPTSSAWEGRLPAGLAQLDLVFGNEARDVGPKDVRQLRQSLEKILGPREDWSVGLLRALFDALLARAKRRRRSQDHERVWFNLAGWCLRPGVGAELDDWRIGQAWALYGQGLAYPQSSANWTEWWVFWRRIAAGLDEARQMEMLEAVAGCMQKTVQQPRRAGNASAKGVSRSAPYGSYDDMLRLFAAMEAVPWSYRQEMGQWMLKRLKKPGESIQTWWAIGRLAARQSLAANAHLVMPPEAAAEFLEAAMAQDWRRNEVAMFAAVQMARMTGDRARDLPDDVRSKVLARLREAHAPQRWVEMVETVQALDAEDQKRSFGDSLPPGLVLI